MITGIKGVILIDTLDADYLVQTLNHDFAALAKQGLRPSERVMELHRCLTKAVANASDPAENACAHVSHVGTDADSSQTAPYDLVDTGEAARILGCTPANVRDLARRGRLRAHRAGRGWVYPAASVVALSERRAAQRG